MTVLILLLLAVTASGMILVEEVNQGPTAFRSLCESRFNGRLFTLQNNDQKEQAMALVADSPLCQRALTGSYAKARSWYTYDGSGTAYISSIVEGVDGNTVVTDASVANEVCNDHSGDYNLCALCSGLVPGLESGEFKIYPIVSLKPEAAQGHCDNEGRHLATLGNVLDKAHLIAVLESTDPNKCHNVILGTIAATVDGAREYYNIDCSDASYIAGHGKNSNTDGCTHIGRDGSAWNDPNCAAYDDVCVVCRAGTLEVEIPVADCPHIGGQFYPFIEDRTKETSALACQHRCNKIKECWYFSFWPTDGGCHLSPLDATYYSYPGVAGGPVDCDAECFTYDKQYNVFIGGRTVEPNAAACQARCKATDGCAYFSRWSNGGCHLSPAEASPIKALGVTSGPADCGVCFTSDRRYSPIDDIDGQSRTVERTALACQARCARVGGCAYFSMWADGGCHLSSAKASLVAGSGTTSGPRVCSAVPYVPCMNNPSAAAMPEGIYIEETGDEKTVTWSWSMTNRQLFAVVLSAAAVVCFVWAASIACVSCMFKKRYLRAREECVDSYAKVQLVDSSSATDGIGV